VKTSSINLVLDATYFGREYGFFCFSDGKNIIYSKEIKTEGVKVFKECLTHLEDKLGYSFKAFVLDGKRGFILKDQFKCATSIRRLLLEDILLINLKADVGKN
jgi:hypothetical protein